MTTRRLLAALAVLAAACSGGGDAAPTSTTVTTTVSTTAPGSSTTALASTTTMASSTTTIAPTTTSTPAPDPDPTFYVFMPRGLPDDYMDRTSQIFGVSDVALVRTKTLHISETRDASGEIVDQPRSGYVIPVQGIGIDPEAHAPLVAEEVATTILRLAPNEVLLGAASAELRRLDVGGTITFEDGRTVTVAGIVDDTEFGNEELVSTDATLIGGVGSELRFSVVRYAGDEMTLTEELERVLPEDAGFGVNPRGNPEDQTTAVRSQIFIKQTFGEFAYRPGRLGGSFTIDPAWVSDNIVTETLPVIGTVRCHRNLIPVLRDVMNELEARDAGNVIQRSAYRGCFNPRYVANSMRMSRHAWGAAADINFFNQLDGGLGSPVNPILLEVMAQFGMTSGHDWSIPDPGHFEYYGFPGDE